MIYLRVIQGCPPLMLSYDTFDHFIVNLVIYDMKPQIYELSLPHSYTVPALCNKKLSIIKYLKFPKWHYSTF